jgi:hypothetical protein
VLFKSTDEANLSYSALSREHGLSTVWEGRWDVRV